MASILAHATIAHGGVTITTGEHALVSLFSMAGVPVWIHPLAPEPGGDAAWCTPQGQVVSVERKTIADLVRSQQSGRLADQLRRASKHYDVIVLVVELDQPKDHETVFWDEHGFTRVMNELETFMGKGLRVEWVPPEFREERFLSLYRYFQKPRHYATHRIHVKGHIFSNLPGLGPKRVELLLRAFLTQEGAESVVYKSLGKGALSQRLLAAAREGK